MGTHDGTAPDRTDLTVAMQDGGLTGPTGLTAPALT